MSSDIKASSEEIGLGVGVLGPIAILVLAGYLFAREKTLFRGIFLAIAIAILLIYIFYFMLYGNYNWKELAELASKDQTTFRVKIGDSTNYETVSAAAAEAASDSILAIKRKTYLNALKDDKIAVTPFLDALNEQYKGLTPAKVVEYTSITPPAKASAYRRARY